MKNLKRKQRLEDKRSRFEHSLDSLSRLSPDGLTGYQQSQSASGDQPVSEETFPDFEDHGRNESRKALRNSETAQSKETGLDLSFPLSPAPPWSMSAARSASTTPATRQTRTTIERAQSPGQPPRSSSRSVQEDSGKPMSSLSFPFSLHGWQAGGSNPSFSGPGEFHKLVASMESCACSL